MNYEWKPLKVVAGQQIYVAEDEHGTTIFTIQGGLIRYKMTEAEADAENHKEQQDRKTVEDLHPASEPPDEAPSEDEDQEQEPGEDEGPGEEPPAPAPVKRRGPKIG